MAPIPQPSLQEEEEAIAASSAQERHPLMSVNAQAPASPPPSASMHPLPAQETAAASSFVPPPRGLLRVPVPLRPSLSPYPPPLPATRWLFDFEYDTLLQWQRHLFATFTREMQRSLGSSVKEYVRLYSLAAAQGATPGDPNDTAAASAHSALLLKTFADAREAVISAQEMSHRTREHADWVITNVNQTRLELMNLRYSRSPYGVLKEAIELARVIRSYILEITKAMQQNNGIPWPLERKTGSLDVTPEHVKELAKTMALYDVD